MTDKKLKTLRTLLKEFSSLIGYEQPLASMAVGAIIRMVDCYIEG